MKALLLLSLVLGCLQTGPTAQEKGLGGKNDGLLIITKRRAASVEIKGTSGRVPAEITSLGGRGRESWRTPNLEVTPLMSSEDLKQVELDVNETFHHGQVGWEDMSFGFAISKSGDATKIYECRLGKTSLRQAIPFDLKDDCRSYPNFPLGDRGHSVEEFRRGSIHAAMTVGINWDGNIHRYVHVVSNCYLVFYVDDGASKYLHNHKNFLQKSESDKMVIGGAKHKIYPKCVDSPFSLGSGKFTKFFSDDSGKPLFEPQWQSTPDGFDDSRLYLSGQGGELSIVMALVHADGDDNDFDDDHTRLGGEGCRLTADAGGNIKDLKCERISAPRKYSHN